MKSYNKYFRTSLFILIALILLVSSCSPSATATEQPTAIIAPSITLPVATNTFVPSPTIQPTSGIKLEEGCMTLEDGLPSDIHLLGVWVRRRTNPYLENIEENTKYRIPMKGGGAFLDYDGYFSISPNRKWLAYLDANLDTSESGITRTDGYALQVIHSSGRSLSMEYWPVSPQYIYGWVDDQNLLLGLNRRNIVLNPFTGEWHEVVEPIWLNDIVLDDSRFNIKKYSPHTAQVIIWLKDHSELRDVNTGELIFGNSKLGFFEQSEWASDGNMLTITTDKGKVLHIFQNKNEILQIDLVKQKLASVDLGGNIYFSNIKWSSNDKVLLLETLDESFILDLDKQKIYSLCFNDTQLEFNWSRQSILYPSDGQYLFTQVLLKDVYHGYQSFDLLIDIKNLRAFKLADSHSGSRIEWLETP